jgi:hypothetical protein
MTTLCGCVLTKVSVVGLSAIHHRLRKAPKSAPDVRVAVGRPGAGVDRDRESRRDKPAVGHANPPASEPDLARSLNNLAVLLARRHAEPARILGIAR